MTGLKSELDIFETPATQTSMERGYFYAYPPNSALTDQGPIEFYVSGNGNEYIDLMNTMLYMKVRIVKGDGTPLGAEEQDQVAPVNYLLHSMFSQVEVSLNGRTMGYSNSLYPHRAMIEALTNFGPGAANGHLRSALFYKDTAGSMDETDPTQWNVNQLVKGFHDLPESVLSGIGGDGEGEGEDEDAGNFSILCPPPLVKSSLHHHHRHHHKQSFTLDQQLQYQVRDDDGEGADVLAAAVERHDEELEINQPKAPKNDTVVATAAARARARDAHFGNNGLYKRWLHSRRSQSFDMIGPIHADIFQQEKYLLNNVDLALKLTRSKPPFNLMSNATAAGQNAAQFKIKIEEATLFPSESCRQRCRIFGATSHPTTFQCHLSFELRCHEIVFDSDGKPYRTSGQHFPWSTTHSYGDRIFGQRRHKRKLREEPLQL